MKMSRRDIVGAVVAVTAGSLVGFALISILFWGGRMPPTPRGIEPVSFWLILCILPVLGEAVGFRRRKQSFSFWFGLSCMLLIARGSLLTSSFWGDVWGAPVTAMLWWALTFALGLALGYFARRRTQRTERLQ